MWRIQGPVEHNLPLYTTLLLPSCMNLQRNCQLWAKGLKYLFPFLPSFRSAATDRWPAMLSTHSNSTKILGVSFHVYRRTRTHTCTHRNKPRLRFNVIVKSKHTSGQTPGQIQATFVSWVHQMNTTTRLQEPVMINTCDEFLIEGWAGCLRALSAASASCSGAEKTSERWFAFPPAAGLWWTCRGSRFSATAYDMRLIPHFWGGSDGEGWSPACAGKGQHWLWCHVY